MRIIKGKWQRELYKIKANESTLEKLVKWFESNKIKSKFEDWKVFEIDEEKFPEELKQT